MKLLGAIIAGGTSRRFDGDKAAAMLDGRALIDHVRDALSPQVADVVVCGREWPGLVAVADRPGRDMGPLGGLCGAMNHAAVHGYGAVLTAGCDVLPIPDLGFLVGTDAAVVEGQWLLGFWPVALLPQLEFHLAETTDLSVRAWMRKSGARRLACAVPFHNLNTREAFSLHAQALDAPQVS